MVLIIKVASKRDSQKHHKNGLHPSLPWDLNVLSVFYCYLDVMSLALYPWRVVYASLRLLESFRDVYHARLIGRTKPLFSPHGFVANIFSM